MFRFYKVTDGSHFFTSNEGEKNQVEAQGGAYRYEGVAFYSYPNQQAGTSPVHRFYNFRQGVHFYTSDQNEYLTVLNTATSTYRYEGIAYYANTGPGANLTPVYRFYKFRQGVHFYTRPIRQKRATSTTRRPAHTVSRELHIISPLYSSSPARAAG